MSYSIYITYTNNKRFNLKCDMFSIGNDNLTCWLFNKHTDKKPIVCYQVNKLFVASVTILNKN